MSSRKSSYIQLADGGTLQNKTRPRSASVTASSRSLIISCLTIGFTVACVFSILSFVWDTRILDKVSDISRSSRRGSLPPLNEDGWVNWGANIHNTRSTHDTYIGRNNVASLSVKWTHTLNNASVSATPTVHGDDLYYPDWKGMLWRLNRKTGDVIWSLNLTPIALTHAPDGLARGLSRTSPAYHDGVLYLGIQKGALLLAVRASDGHVIWVHRTQTHPLAIITQSPTVYNGVVFVGVASLEEGSSAGCCSFQGSFGAYSTADGSLMWSVRMLPDNQGATDQYAGAAVWGSSPSIDRKRNQVFIGTGNTYKVPATMEVCRSIYDELAGSLIRDPCVEQSVLQESIVAFDIATGRINWVSSQTPLDSWIVACGVPGRPRNFTACPQVPGPDADFGQAPMFVEGGENTPDGIDVVTVGQKNGVLWALSAETGRTLWSAQVAPSGVAGGLEWGSATDGRYVFFASSNSNSRPHVLVNGQNITYGSWGAVSLRTGQILWQTADPGHSSAYGPVSVANGVVYAGSRGANGFFVAMNSDTGEILFQTQLGKTIGGGASVVGKYIYVGTGYASFVPNDPGTLVALSL